MRRGSGIEVFRQLRIIFLHQRTVEIFLDGILTASEEKEDHTICILASPNPTSSARQAANAKDMKIILLRSPARESQSILEG
ncbi:MAG: hypothetical protein CL912_18405 [Deltaproteobacteria bacterium]|nr:hypothetical protein [Deltaproteobacteria bacterium]